MSQRHRTNRYSIEPKAILAVAWPEREFSWASTSEGNSYSGFACLADQSHRELVVRVRKLRFELSLARLACYLEACYGRVGHLLPPLLCRSQFPPFSLSDCSLSNVLVNQMTGAAYPRGDAEQKAELKEARNAPRPHASKKKSCAQPKENLRVRAYQESPNARYERN